MVESQKFMAEPVKIFKRWAIALEMREINDIQIYPNTIIVSEAQKLAPKILAETFKNI